MRLTKLGIFKGVLPNSYKLMGLSLEKVINLYIPKVPVRTVS